MGGVALSPLYGQTLEGQLDRESATELACEAHTSGDAQRGVMRGRFHPAWHSLRSDCSFIAMKELDRSIVFVVRECSWRLLCKTATAGKNRSLERRLATCGELWAATSIEMSAPNLTFGSCSG